MSANERPNTELTTAVELELKSLQKKVEQLVLRCHALETKNQQLNDRQSKLVKEQVEQKSNTTLVNNRIEIMLSRLKTLEHNV